MRKPPNIYRVDTFLLSPLDPLHHFTCPRHPMRQVPFMLNVIGPTGQNQGIIRAALLLEGSGGDSVSLPFLASRGACVPELMTPPSHRSSLCFGQHLSLALALLGPSHRTPCGTEPTWTSGKASPSRGHELNDIGKAHCTA